MSRSSGGTSVPNYRPRTLDLLITVGAVAPPEAALMRRAVEFHGDTDEVSPSALEHLNAPHVQASLFPAEKRLQPKLARHLEWEEIDAPAKPVLKEPSIEVRDVSRGPAKLEPTAGVAISALPECLRVLAKRVQLVAENNPKKKTILLGSIESMLEHESFTGAERRLLVDLRRAVTDQLTAQPNQMKAILEVPQPGEHRTLLEHSGSTQLWMVHTITLREQATLNSAGELRRHLSLHRQGHFEIDVPEGERVALLRIEPTRMGEDQAFGPGRHRVEYCASDIRVERWKDGERLESSNLRMPLLFDKKVALKDHIGFELRSNGDPLPRTLVSIVEPAKLALNDSDTTANFVYDFETEPLKHEDVALFDARPCPIEAGRYELPRDVTVEVFPSGAVKMESPTCKGTDGALANDETLAHCYLHKIGVGISSEGIVTMEVSGTPQWASTLAAYRVS